VNKTILGISEGKERPRRKWEDNSTMYLNETKGEIVDWIHLDFFSVVMEPVAQSPDY
jgi:hypothetical protein